MELAEISRKAVECSVSPGSTCPFGKPKSPSRERMITYLISPFSRVKRTAPQDFSKSIRFPPEKSGSLKLLFNLLLAEGNADRPAVGAVFQIFPGHDRFGDGEKLLFVTDPAGLDGGFAGHGVQ